MTLFSCSKELKENDATVDGVNVPEHYKMVEFVSEIATKTAIDMDNGQVSWKTGDKIRVWYVDADDNPASFLATAIGNGTSTTFAGAIPETDDPDHFWAVYPEGSGTLTYVSETETFSVKVGTASDGSFESANIMAAYTTAESASFAFKNAVGIIRLELPAGGVIRHNDVDYPITRIRLKGKETSIYSQGTVAVTSDGSQVTGFAASSGAQNAQVTLSDAARASGVAYIPSFPGELTHGFAVKYITNDADALIPAVMTKDVSVTVERGHILPLSELSSRIIWDWYVSPSGSGDGKSAGDPMSLADFATLVNEGKTDAGALMTSYANRLNGATFHFLPGTYTMSEPITFPDASEGATIFLDGDDAVLDGNNATHMMIFSGAKLKVNLSNLTFQNGNNSGSGGAVYMGSGSTTIFTNCIFDSNQTTKTSGGGGAVCITNSNTTGYFSRCLFTRNSATNAHGGAFYVTNGKTVLTDCTFGGKEGYGNTAANYGGVFALSGANLTFTVDGGEMSYNSAKSSGAGYLNITGPVQISNVDIHHNTATAGTGGAFYDYASEIFTLSGCVLANNSATSSGSAILSSKASGNVLISACDFIGNSSTANSAGAITIGADFGGSFYITHSKFIGNSCRQFGAGIHQVRPTTPTSIVAINNSLFWRNTTNTNAAQVSIGSGVMLLFNSTFIQDAGGTSSGTGGAIRCGAFASDKAMLLNNIVINTGASYAYSINTAANNKYYIRSLGYNLFSSRNTGTNGYTESSLDNAFAYPTTYSTPSAENDYLWSWSNSATSGMASADTLEDIINNDASLGKTGTGEASDFLSWLKSIQLTNGNAWQTDCYGTRRNSSAYWPGCYQN